MKIVNNFLKKSKYYLIVLAFFFLSYLIIIFFMGHGNFSFLKSYLQPHQINLIKKYVFPYKVINQQETKISQQKNKILKLQSEISDLGKIVVRIGEVEKITLTNDLVMSKYQLKENFYTNRPGGYIDFHLNTLIVLSANNGILGYIEKQNNTNYFKIIKNNINDIINLKEAQKKHEGFSIKDLMIKNNNIFVSYTEEIEKNCWNTSVMYSEMNYTNIKFEKLFSSKECIFAEKGTWESGGRIVNFNDNHILLSIGDYGDSSLAQEKSNINGKVIKINVQSLEYEILSMGHRNPQGLYYDKENNFILETEHGPSGGDEINLLKIKDIKENQPLNFGWAIVSEGEHYCSKGNLDNLSEECEDKYKKYPLYKSHTKYGFLEPLKSFTPSIGISEITKIGKKKYVVSSLREGSLFYFELNSENNIKFMNKIIVNDRIRDLKVNDDNLYLFLDTSSSIGVISLDNFY